MLSLLRRDATPGAAFSIRSYLQVLIAAILLPMLVLVAYLAWHYGSASRRTIEAARLDVVSNLTHLAQREIQATAGFLSGVATSPGLQAGNPDAQQRVTRVAVAAGFFGVGIFDTSGQLVFSGPAAATPVFADTAVAGVPEILGGRKQYVSDLVMAGDARLFIVSVPIMVDGRVAFVLAGALPVQRLQKLFAESGMRDAWASGIVDRQGVILARSQRPESYVGKVAQPPMVAAARGEPTYGLFETVSRDGIEVKNAFRRIPDIGWTVGVAVPSAIVNAPLWNTGLTMAAIGLGLTLLAVLLGSLIANRIAHGVHQLGHAAVGLASGDIVPLQVSRTAQLSDVSHALEAAAAAAQRREAMRRK
jgi:hypothetical protein